MYDSSATTETAFPIHGIYFTCLENLPLSLKSETLNFSVEIETTKWFTYRVLLYINNNNKTATMVLPSVDIFNSLSLQSV